MWGEQVRMRETADVVYFKVYLSIYLKGLRKNMSMSG
jgi:hypothetical protein